MEIDIGTAIALGGLAFTAGGAYALVKSVNSKLAEYEKKKDDQARRIGKTEARCSVTEGILIGAGMASPRVKNKTGAMGIPLISAGDDERNNDEKE